MRGQTMREMGMKSIDSQHPDFLLRRKDGSLHEHAAVRQIPTGVRCEVIDFLDGMPPVARPYLAVNGVCGVVAYRLPSGAEKFYFFDIPKPVEVVCASYAAAIGCGESKGETGGSRPRGGARRG